MSSDDEEAGWTRVHRGGARKAKRDTRVYMREDEARRLERELKIYGLAATLVGHESRRLQDDGFAFGRVVTHKEAASLHEDFDTRLVPVGGGNEWGDYIVFTR